MLTCPEFCPDLGAGVIVLTSYLHTEVGSCTQRGWCNSVSALGAVEYQTRTQPRQLFAYGTANSCHCILTACVTFASVFASVDSTPSAVCCTAAWHVGCSFSTPLAALLRGIGRQSRSTSEWKLKKNRLSETKRCELHSTPALK